MIFSHANVKEQRTIKKIKLKSTNLNPTFVLYRKQWRNTCVYALIKLLFVLVPTSPSIILRSHAVVVNVGILVPKVKHIMSTFCSALHNYSELKSVFSQTKLQGMKWVIAETQQWRRKNLFIRLWLPEHCPVETGGKQTHTRTEKINPNVSSYSFFLAFFHLNTHVFTPASVTLLVLTFLFYIKLYLLFMNGSAYTFIVINFPLLRDSGRLNFPSLSRPPPTPFSRINRNTRTQNVKGGEAVRGGSPHGRICPWKYFAIRSESNR